MSSVPPNPPDLSEISRKLQAPKDYETEFNIFCSLCKAFELDPDAYEEAMDLVFTENLLTYSRSVIVYAAKRGYTKVINYLLLKGNNRYYDGFVAACAGGFLDLVKMFNSYYCPSTEKWNQGYIAACKRGHNDVALYIENEVTKIMSVPMPEHILLYGSCLLGNSDFLKMTPKNKETWNWALKGLCYNGSIELINQFIEHSSKHSDYGLDWDSGLLEASIKGHVTVADLMIQKGATNWCYALDVALKKSHIDLIKYLSQKSIFIMWNGIDVACQKGNLEAFSIFFENVTLSRESWFRIVNDFYTVNSLHIIEFIKSKYKYQVPKDMIEEYKDYLLKMKYLLQVLNTDIVQTIKNYV